MLQVVLLVQHFMCHVHYYGRIRNRFVKKLVNLNHLVGACLCYGLMDCNLRVQPLQICVPV